MKQLIPILFLMTGLITPKAFSHCEIPCGIYGDEMRFNMIHENIDTVEKSMKQIMELSGAGDKNYNQIVRWTTNKETHAGNIQHIVTQYFMTQRVKAVDGSDAAAVKEYNTRLQLLHEMLVFTMKTKQTTDTAHTEKLRALTDEFYTAYFGKDHKRHDH